VLTDALNDGVVDAAMFHAGGNRKRRLFVPQDGLNSRDSAAVALCWLPELAASWSGRF